LGRACFSESKGPRRGFGLAIAALLGALVGARVRAVAALGDYERALALVERELAPIAPEAVPSARVAVYRAGATATLAANDGENGLQWLETLAALPGAELTPVELRP
jgi:hypothetical protein